MGGLSEGQLVALAVSILAFAAGIVGMVWFWLDVRRQRREAEEQERKTVPTEPPRMRLARSTKEWAFPMPPPAAKKYVPPVNGAVRVRPGGYVPPGEPSRWDLFVPPRPVDIPVIPSAPALPHIDYWSAGGRFGGAGATESWPEVERQVPAASMESGVREVSSVVDSGSGGGDVGSGGEGGGGPD